MNVAIVGMGLIGGSFYKASLRAGHTVTALHHGDTAGCEQADLVLVCLPPDAVVPWIVAHAPTFKSGAVVEYAIIAENTVIGENAHVGEEPQPDSAEKGIAVVAQDLKVGAGATVPAAAMITKNVKGVKA